MKKSLLFITVFFCFISSQAQQSIGITGETNWFNNWTNFKPKTTIYQDPTHILSGEISKNTVLSKKNVYLLMNVVYLTNNATLTIEPGTVIRGDYNTCGTLVITKGAQIIAEGTVTDPIVFTSNKGDSERKPGDWGGIVVLGDAPINKYGGISSIDFNLDPKHASYGGENKESNSGIFKYVRIEFSGRKLNSHKELNGLSLAGVGSKTKIDFVQISFSNDDSFECYGGDLSLNNLISFRATDDDFDFTQGAQCKINNSVAIRFPFSSDISRSRCFEIDSYDKVENFDFSKKMTTIIANNISLINNEENSQGLVKEAIYVKTDSFLTMKNSLISGFEKSILIDDKLSEVKNIEKIKLENILFNSCNGNIVTETGQNNDLVMNWFSNDKFNLRWSKTNKAELFEESEIKKNPDLRIKTANITTSRVASN